MAISINIAKADLGVNIPTNDRITGVQITRHLKTSSTASGGQTIWRVRCVYDKHAIIDGNRASIPYESGVVAEFDFPNDGTDISNDVVSNLLQGAYGILGKSDAFESGLGV
jgi:hypothetical protein